MSNAKDDHADAGEQPGKKVPYRTTVVDNKTYRWCSCGLSKRQPYCDEAHRGTEFKPVLFKGPGDMTVALCGCKLTTHPPYCDGNHIKLKQTKQT